MSRATEPYIFCIGFNKCGTSALHAFFECHGIASVHWDGGRLARTMLSNIVESRKVLDGYDRTYRAFSDMTFLNDRICIEGNEFFQHLDADYPDSLFVYNTRDMSAWLQSRRNHLNEATGSLMRRYMAVLNTAREEVVMEHWSQQRLRLESAIGRYFSGSKRLLTFDIADADAGDRLARFFDLKPNDAAWRRVNPTVSVGGEQSLHPKHRAL